MKIVFLCKRYPQQRDLLERPYGRFFYLPYFLSQCGLDVTIILVDYKNGQYIHQKRNGMSWHVVPISKYWPFSVVKIIGQIIQSIKPTWIAGLSDTWYGIMAHRLGSRYGYKVLIDAYDNYESYIPWLKPLHFAWRNACRHADLLTAAGPQLLELMNKGRDANKNSCILPMAADPIFTPHDMQKCRSVLNLPAGKLIGYLGSLHPNRDPNQFFEIVQAVCNIDPSIKFFISGYKHSSISIPIEIRSHIIELGYIADELMPIACNAANLLLALGKPSNFGNYAYPVKIYEGLQCNKPVFATRTDSTEWILKDNQDLLIEWNNSSKTATTLCSNINIASSQHTPTEWREIAQTLLKCLTQ
jgi:glycosyltransferase involved in cell wall biosynthesis